MATFCLIHGNWHDGASWGHLVGCLDARGHDAVAPDLPIDDPETTWEERAEPALRALADVEGPVAIVAHSGSSGYGALVAARLEDPLLVHLCPRLTPFSAPPNGPDAFRPGFPFPPRRPDGANVWERPAAIEALYPRLPRDAAEALADRLRPAAPPPDDYPLPGHPDVATALIYASEDEIFEPEWERFMARELLDVEPIEIPGGHFPMVEDPDGLADLLDLLSRERPTVKRARGSREGSG
ncbi:MAG: alpha/beta fold hydrolase [Solirubrobacterales bacterium]